MKSKSTPTSADRPARPSHRRSFAQAARSAFAFDTSHIEYALALRCTAGVAVPLLAALATGYPAYGVAASIGALSVGFASRQGVYRTRAATMLWTALGMALSTAAGAFASHTPVAMIAVAILWGYAYGLTSALSPAATAIGLNSCVALVLASAYVVDLHQLAVQSLLVLCGGLFQTLLLVAVWPMRSYAIERQALFEAYRSLAAYARAVATGSHALPESAAFQNVRVALADPQPFARRRDIMAFQVLRDEAERIRASLAALAAEDYVWESRNEPAMRAAIERVANGTAALLDAIARSLREASTPRDDGDAWARATKAADTVNARPGARSAHSQSQALIGQLRAAWRSAGFPVDASTPDAAVPRLLRPHRDNLRDLLLTIRSNCGYRSPVGRHAIRVALALGLAIVVAQHLPAQRGYWIALTVVLILKPDFSTTFARGFARIGGTLAGAAFITALVVYTHPGPQITVALAILFAALGYAVFSINYALYTFTVTAYVVVLLAILGIPAHAAVVARVIDTLTGGVLAAFVYLLWPTWEAGHARERLADLLDADRLYAKAVLAGYVDPAARNLQARRSTQSAAWAARVEAEASVDRISVEPTVANGIPHAQALSVLAGSQRLALALLALNAHAQDAAPVARPALESVARKIDEVLVADICALRSGVAPKTFGSLRDGYRALERVSDRGADPDADLILAEADLIVDSLNTLTELLSVASLASATATPSIF